MDTRNQPPALQSFKPVTAASLAEHFPEVETALELKPDTLRALFGTNNLASLTDSLDLIRDDSIRLAQKSIENLADTYAGDTEELIRYFAHKRTYLHSVLDKLAVHLTAQKQTTLDEHAATINNIQQKLIQPNECCLGNHALRLSALKENIARALQNAAFSLHQYWHDLRDNRDTFNTLFTDVAWINPDKKLVLFPGATKDFAAMDLTRLQKDLLALQQAGRANRNPLVIRTINENLVKLCSHDSALDQDGAALVSMKNGNFSFTHKAYDLEKAAYQAAEDANNLLSNLEKLEESKAFAYDNDPTKLEQFQLIRNVIANTQRDLPNVNIFVHNNKSLAAGLHQDINEIENLLFQLREIAERGPEDSRAATAAMLENLEFTPQMRKKIIDGMQEVFNHFHHGFQKKHRPDFIFKHYSALAAQLTSMEAQLARILDETLNQIPPLTNLTQRLHEIEQHRKTLMQALLQLYDIVEKMDAEYKKIDGLFSDARLEFFKFLTDIQQNEWREDLLLRLDATLLDIDDLIKKYANHPVFRHTSLDDVIIEIMREAREKTLATRETVEPHFVPPTLRPAPVLTFWERRPNARKILYGAVVGIGLAVCATLAVAAIFFSLGIGTLPVAAVAGILVGTAIASGAAGTALGFGLHNKVQSIHSATIKTEAPQQIPSSTASAFRTLKTSGKADEGYDSDDEEEAVADYSNHVIFANDPPEYAPSRLRLT